MLASGSEMMTGVCALDTLIVSSSTVTTTSWYVGTGDSFETWEDILGSPDVCHFSENEKQSQFSKLILSSQPLIHTVTF
jgi:hypothetical protein